MIAGYCCYKRTFRNNEEVYANHILAVRRR